MAEMNQSSLVQHVINTTHPYIYLYSTVVLLVYLNMIIHKMSSLT